jgi:glyoxylase-like metal-dependent hydrolase (beta-lactamase superfamily II)
MAIRENFKEGPVEGIRVGRFGRGINTTAVLYRIGATLVDCGPPNQWRHVKRFLGERPVLTVLLTHHHEDHAGNASRLQARGAEILAPEKALAPLKDGFAMLAYRRIIWGRPKRVQAGALPGKAELEDGSHLIPIPAPGHSPDLTCFHSPRHGWLFGGDIYIAGRLKYLRSDENLEQQIESLKRAVELDFKVLFCTHRGVVADGRAALRQKLDNLVSLRQEARDLAGRGVGAREITRRLLGEEDFMYHLTRGQYSKLNLILGCLNGVPESGDAAAEGKRH